jgi:hypothetical protein
MTAQELMAAIEASRKFYAEREAKAAKNRAKHHRYNCSAKGKARNQRYSATEKGRWRHWLYNQSHKGRLRRHFYIDKKLRDAKRREWEERILAAIYGGKEG